MKKFAPGLFIFTVFFLLLPAGCGSDKNTDEACVYETTMNLDQGNYDAVLASTCADAMQIGAAWFGKAGYDITNVINRFIDANDSNQADSDLNIYITSLTGNVSSNTINFLDNAKNSYNAILGADPGYRDAQFYVSLVETMNALSFIRLGIQDSAGSVDFDCDLNGNGKADGIDATACALKLTYGQTCDSIASAPTITYTTVPDLTITKADGTTLYPGTFVGLIITTGTGTTPSCTGRYTKIQYPDGASPSGFKLATTTQDRCTGDAYNTSDPQGLWPCPIDNSQYLDFVTSIDASLTTAITSMDNSLLTDASGTTDVQQSINDIKAEHCCFDPGEIWDSSDPGSCSCSSVEMADYLQTI